MLADIVEDGNQPNELSVQRLGGVSSQPGTRVSTGTRVLTGTWNQYLTGNWVPDNSRVPGSYPGNDAGTRV